MYLQFFFSRLEGVFRQIPRLHSLFQLSYLVFFFQLLLTTPIIDHTSFPLLTNNSKDFLGFLKEAEVLLIMVFTQSTIGGVLTALSLGNGQRLEFDVFSSSFIVCINSNAHEREDSELRNSQSQFTSRAGFTSGGTLVPPQDLLPTLLKTTFSSPSPFSLL